MVAEGFWITNPIWDPSKEMLIVSLQGQLDASEVQQFRDQLIATCDKYPTLKVVRVDVGGLRYVSSTGIGAIIDTMKLLRSRWDAELQLCRVQQPVRQLIDLLGFSPYLSIKD